MTISQAILDEIALSQEEYQLIVKRLEREPNLVELGMFGSLWSEHCGYKHSKPLLAMFPKESPRVLVKAGEENAGAVDIGDGLAVVMKVESHNHPSAIEPYQGAATGVGGIVRDIFAMGARPIALLNSLRFGPLSEPRNRYLFGGVVGGISGYGNCLGIPDVGGEVFFDSAYSNNPLINAMCVGLVEAKKLISARASGPGSLLMLVGADTGRDGIHGASGLASRTFEGERELRSTVQVGNPFMEKLLMEACMELAETDWMVGLQDLGAAGLTSACVEAAARGGCGIEIDIAKVPRRETGMTPYEVMLSESQERMLVIAKKGYEDKVMALFQRWDLHSEIIGVVTDDGMVRIKEGAQVVADLPIFLLTSPPQYRLQGQKPAELEKLQRHDFSGSALLTTSNLPPSQLSSSQILLKLLASPNIASKEWVYRQYDHQVMTNTVVGPGSDAAVLRIKGTGKGIALTTDGNGRLCYLDPYVGGALAVAEAARNLVCVGAEPLALTDCLNFGNPERPEVYYQLEECIRGMTEACRTLGVPVISGNVSLYNETGGQAVYPTPVVGMLGLLEDVEKRCNLAFRDEGDVVFLLGENLDSSPTDATDPWGLGGSEYLWVIHGLVAGRPRIDLRLEARVQKLALGAIRQGLLKSAHDCSEGGLGVALAECSIGGGIGFRGDGTWGITDHQNGVFFGERSSRIVVSVAPGNTAALESLAREAMVPIAKLGVVDGRRFHLGGIDLLLDELEEAWRQGLTKALG